MIILSHRGYWKTPQEKNREGAFRHSFESGFGTETDIRDLAGTLVISHDPPTGGEITFEQFLRLYREYATALPLALNIKADGLQSLIKDMIEQYGVADYFVFDMSMPDALLYCKIGLNFFTRQSEWEKETALYECAKGVWLDSFVTDWVTAETIREHLEAGKKVCIVSPELHNRPHIRFWKMIKEMPFSENPEVMICTDFPAEASEFFSKKDMLRDD